MSTKDKVCAEFCARFPSHRKDITNEERISFMFSQPSIRSKLDEWIGGGGTGGSGVGVLMDKKKASNVNHQFIEPDVNYQIKSQEPKPIPTNLNNQYSKHPGKSETQRKIGNLLFIQKKMFESIDAYNEAIRFAPICFENLTAEPKVCNKNEFCELFPLSLANRSAVYFELGEEFYDRCLSDIETALKFGYPNHFKGKILLRKANIYAKRKDWKMAQSIFQEVSNMDNLDPNVIEKMNELSAVIEQNDLTTKDSGNNENEQVAFDFVENCNFENASIKVKLGYTEESTRFVTANADLKKGDVLFYESPFASVLLPPFYETHCHNCHKILQQHFMPCRKCSQVKFCSESCANSAWDKYHSFECFSLDFLHSIGIGHLAVRIVLSAGPEIMSAIKNQSFLGDPKNTDIFHKGYSNYYRVYSLLDHLQIMPVEDVFQYTLTASLITNWLAKKTTFFHNIGQVASSDDKIGELHQQIGGTVLKHISQLICNAHAITDILGDINNKEMVSLSTADESQERIATAIFPAASMMNHSCDPQIIFSFKDGKNLLVKLTQNLKQGEEIFNCYGPHYRRMSVSSRQESLSDQYFFECKCRHCIEEEEKGISFVEKFSGYKCEDCNGPVLKLKESEGTCQSCGHEMELQEQMMGCISYIDRLFQDGEVLLERGNVTQALKLFLNCRDQYRAFVYQYHSSLGQLSDLIGRCYTILGEFDKAAKFIKESLEYVEIRFGSESLEYGREVKKYVDILSRCKVVDDQEIDTLSNLYKSILIC